ncbi:MAG: 4-hydroxythreonine-4-phosphate dehydrogenase PdxA, partial [Planctomycetota bacterium]|nr:4-hydroxythreonine-4-phosphate dehydrogenase PdxA [Planctomycetota bacterium]
MDNSTGKPIIGVLLGDATGIGPELIAKIIAEGYFAPRCHPIVIGDRRVLEQGMRQAGADFSFRVISAIDKPDLASPVNLLDTGNLDPAKVKIGEISAVSGKAMAETLLRTVDYCRLGHLNGIVFAPLNKAALKAGGYDCESEHSLVGHHLGLTTPFGEINVLDGVFTTRVTSHIPLKDVSAQINRQSVLAAIRLLDDTVRRAGNPRPRLGVAALNPHSGENGTCGREEIDAIAPAVAAARTEGMDAVGPISADVL